MDIDKRIKRLSSAAKNIKPSSCRECQFIHEDALARSCSLMGGSWDSVIEYELANNEVAFNCPLLDKDSDDYQEILDQLESLVELKESRIKLREIERIAREAFSNPETQDINLYRAQKLADIFAIFEYNGATIKDKEVKANEQ